MGTYEECVTKILKNITKMGGNWNLMYKVIIRTKWGGENEWKTALLILTLFRNKCSYIFKVR